MVVELVVVMLAVLAELEMLDTVVLVDGEGVDLVQELELEVIMELVVQEVS